MSFQHLTTRHFFCQQSLIANKLTEKIQFKEKFIVKNQTWRVVFLQYVGTLTYWVGDKYLWNIILVWKVYVRAYIIRKTHGNFLWKLCALISRIIIKIHISRKFLCWISRNFPLTLHWIYFYDGLHTRAPPPPYSPYKTPLLLDTYPLYNSMIIMISSDKLRLSHQFSNWYSPKILLALIRLSGTVSLSRDKQTSKSQRKNFRNFQHDGKSKK